MKTLELLRKAMVRTNESTLRGLAFDHKPLVNEIRKLDEWLGTVTVQKPAVDQVQYALQQFYRTRALPTTRAASLVCHGCADEFGEGKRRLIEDEHRFPELLMCVDRYRAKSAPFRRCYRGLLGAYFAYDPNLASRGGAGRQNWKSLRNYLHVRIDELARADFTPEWCLVLAQNGNLLREDPCARYGFSLFGEDGSEFERARTALDVSDTSWLVAEFILSHVSKATSAADERFKSYLPRLLPLLEQHLYLRDAGLAKVLERFKECSDRHADNRLRDFAVAAWGNPWVPSNSLAWGRVSDAARQLVSDWLKLDLVRKFFGLLAQDGVNDKRRLRFWEKYHTYIDDMYFALGSQARSSRSADFVRLRKDMRGRVLELASGGSAQNNAFIMCMGKYVAVEFGVSGNACYFFERNKLPFDLNQAVVLGNKSELKHEKHIERLLHVDTANSRWEIQFEDVLQRLIRGKLPRSPVSSIVRTPSQSSSSSRHEPEYSPKEFERFCAEHGLKFRDLTAQRGNLWVLADQPPAAVRGRLLAWGFRHKPGKGWWRGA